MKQGFKVFDPTQLLKYGLISAAGYASILLLMYVLVDLFGAPKLFSYACVYLVAYMAEYYLNLKYLFYKNHSWAAVAKFICHILFFLLCGSLVFKLFLLLDIHYLLATFATAVALMPLRFLAHKLIVFR